MYDDTALRRLLIELAASHPFPRAGEALGNGFEHSRRDPGVHAAGAGARQAA